MIALSKNVELRSGTNRHTFIYKGEEHGIPKGKYADL